MGTRVDGATYAICDQCGKEQEVLAGVPVVPVGWHSIPLSIDDTDHDGPTLLCSFDCLGAWAAAQSKAEVEAAEAAAAAGDVSDDEGVEA